MSQTRACIVLIFLLFYLIKKKCSPNRLFNLCLWRKKISANLKKNCSCCCILDWKKSYKYNNITFVMSKFNYHNLVVASFCIYQMPMSWWSFTLLYNDPDSLLISCDLLKYDHFIVNITCSVQCSFTRFSLYCSPV